jgi:sec-independent protein translocase protein TatA
MGGWEAPWHWVVLAIIVIALFGYKKLPDAARSVGRSLRIFKTEIKGMSEDDKKRESADVAPRQVEAAAPAPPTATITPATPVAPAAAEPAQPAVNVNGTTPTSPVGDQSARPASSGE